MMPSGGTGSCSRLQGGDSWIVVPAKAGVQNLDRSRLSLDSGSRVPRVRNDKPALPLTFRLTRRMYVAPQQRGHRLYGSRERTTKVRPAFRPTPLDTPRSRRVTSPPLGASASAGGTAAHPVPDGKNQNACQILKTSASLRPS